MKSGLAGRQVEPGTHGERREERYIGDKREREERGHNFIFDWN